MRWVRTAPITSAYVATVAGVTVWSLAMGPRHRRRLVAGVSTDLEHLRRRPLLVLPASAFVLEDPSHALLLPALAAVMGEVERRDGTAAAVGTAAAGHVGASLAVAAGLWAGLRARVVDEHWRRNDDAGVSYALLALLPRLLAPPWRRPVSLAGTLALAVPVLRRPEPGDAGHLLAWLIGLALAGGRP